MSGLNFLAQIKQGPRYRRGLEPKTIRVESRKLLYFKLAAVMPINPRNLFPYFRIILAVILTESLILPY